MEQHSDVAVPLSGRNLDIGFDYAGGPGLNSVATKNLYFYLIGVLLIFYCLNYVKSKTYLRKFN